MVQTGREVWTVASFTYLFLMTSLNKGQITLLNYSYNITYPRK